MYTQPTSSPAHETTGKNAGFINIKRNQNQNIVFNFSKDTDKNVITLGVVKINKMTP